MLMLLYNKSKQIEKYINVESDEKNNELWYNKIVINLL
jgi:hypothetical protein